LAESSRESRFCVEKEANGQRQYPCQKAQSASSSAISQAPPALVGTKRISAPPKKGKGWKRAPTQSLAAPRHKKLKASDAQYSPQLSSPPPLVAAISQQAPASDFKEADDPARVTNALTTSLLPASSSTPHTVPSFPSSISSTELPSTLPAALIQYAWECDIKLEREQHARDLDRLYSEKRLGEKLYLEGRRNHVFGLLRNHK
jgi:hypothetical protein